MLFMTSACRSSQGQEAVFFPACRRQIASFHTLECQKFINFFLEEMFFSWSMLISRGVFCLPVVEYFSKLTHN